MAIQSKLSNLPSPQKLLIDTLLNPIITGPLLLYVQRNPSKLPWPPVKYYKLPWDLPFPFPSTIRVGVDPPFKVLKFLFAWGLILYVNRFLNGLALNYWHLRKQGVPWDFQADGRETILITGGCSGFGKEMAKMFGEQTNAKIIVLDIQELPVSLRTGESSHGRYSSSPTF